MPAGSPAAQPATRTSTREGRAKPLCGRLKAKTRPLTLASLLALTLYSYPAHAVLAVAKGGVFEDRHDWLLPILYGLGSMAAFLLLRAVVRSATTAFAKASNRKPSAASRTTVDHFIAESRKLHIDPQIARETFQLLTGLLPAGISIGVHDDLRGALHLSVRQIDSLLSALPELCERSGRPANAASVLSVYDLLQHVESSPRQKSGQFQSRTIPAATLSAAALTSPLADLQHASPRDSRFRTRSHFSGVKRRASDYSGPHRRATDRRPDENYAGPLRRASDRQDTDLTGSDLRTELGTRTEERTADRRSSERRAVVLQGGLDTARQHRAVSADTSLLNQGLSLPAGQAGKDSSPPPMTRDEATLPASIQPG